MEYPERFPRRVGGHTRRARRGFTLVELALAAVTLAALVMVAVPNLRLLQTRSRENSCLTNLRTIRGAVEWYSADHEVAYRIREPGDFDLLIKEGYLEARPRCPEAGRYRAEGGQGRAVCSVHGALE